MAVIASCARAAPETIRGLGGVLLPLNQRGRCGRRSSRPPVRLSRRVAASFCAVGPAGHLALVFYAYPMSRCIVCARGAAMACHTVLVICKGSRWLCRIARLYGRAAPVATAVCAGFADHRAELRLSPEVRSSRMTIGTLRKAGTGVRWFPSRVPEVGVYELLLSRRHDAAAATRYTHYYAPDAKHRRW